MQVAQRLGLLAAIALIVSLAALVVARELDGDSSKRSAVRAQPAPGGSWSEVRTGILEQTAKGETTACGVAIGAKTYGVSHPSLPCGTRIFIAYENIEVLTQVVERGPYVPGRGLELTPALAARLEIDEATEVRWAFAR